MSKRVEQGHLLGQATQTDRNTFNLFYLLYVDDGAFLFTTKDDMKKGADLIHDLFASLGLKMHIGQNGGSSKTEAMYFPPSLQPDQYKVLDMQEKLEVKDGYVTVIRCFKYLGSWISDNLKDEYEVETRVKKGQAQMGSTQTFFPMQIH